jgi:hypothetical protein
VIDFIRCYGYVINIAPQKGRGQQAGAHSNSTLFFCRSWFLIYFFEEVTGSELLRCDWLNI